MITLSSRMTEALPSVRNPPEFGNAHCDRSTFVTVTAENTFDISRVLKLISDPHTDFMYERHKIALRNLRNANIFGIKIRDLIHYCNILNICAKRVTHLSDVYHHSLIELIKLCGNPFLKSLSSDEVNYFSVAVDFMNHFGYLLRVKNEEISLAVCHALEKFYFMKDALNQIPEELKERQTSKKFNQNVVCHSDIIEALLLSYREISETNELSLAIIKLIERLTKYSEMNSNKIILKSGAKIICDHINLPISSNDLLSYSISTLWNLIDSITDESVKIEWMKQIGNEDCLIKLRDIFFTLLAQSHSKFCRNLRNDVLTIILLIIKYANVYGQLKQIRIVETGLVKRLVNLLTFDEFRCMNPLFKNLKLLPNDENFDMKKLIISILVEISNDPVAVYVMSDAGLIKGLFQWICPVIQTNSGYLGDEQRQGLRSSTIFSEYYNLGKCNVQSQSQLTMKNEQDPSEDEEGKAATVDKNSKLKTTQTNLCNEQTDRDHGDHGDEDDDGNTFTKDEKRQNLDVISKWPQAYLEELHLYMLDALATLAPRLLSDCLTYGIPPRLLLLLQWCTSSEPFLGQGNSFHGVGGRNSKRAQLRYSLRLIRSLVETNDERIILDFVCHGLIQFLIPLICPISLRLKSERPHDELLKFGGETLRERRRLQDERNIALTNSKDLVDDEQQEEEDIVGLEMQCDLLLILAKLCDLDAERKQMIGTDGVDAIIQLLKQTSKRLATIESVQYRLLTQSTPIQATSTSSSSSLSSMHSIILYREPLFKLAYALTEAVWSCIIGSNDCEDYFLMKNGATYLLNLLEWYPIESVNYLLGCLVDLTENSKCLPYLSSWSGIRPLNETIDDDNTTRQSSST
ncbi:unnamed protein product [Trichobilharzia szidati]|nr:unnamed protein product [Trichobilharzia szidati]